MDKHALAIAAVFIFATQASAQDRALPAVDARFERILKRLDPSERLMQLCDYTAMAAIRRDMREFRPDRAVAGARAEPKVKRDTLEAKGGAFRSRHKWYKLSYTCSASPDHMTVTAFRYKIGDEIPESQWAGHGLW